MIDFVEGSTIRDYALAVGGIIGPANMVSISRISQNRVCIYLNSEENADVLVSSHKRISINSVSLEIRPLNSKAKRVLISNVHTSIPNKAIEDLFCKYDVTPKSQITRLKTGLNDVGYTHLLSHRRQVYVDAADINKIPQSCQLEHEDVTYWIYFSSDKLACFLCKEEGHTARYCKNANYTESVLATVADLSQVTSKQIITHTNLPNINTSAVPNNNVNTTIESSNNVELPTHSRKRPPAPSTITSATSNLEASVLQLNSTHEDKSESVLNPARTDLKGTFKTPKKKVKINSNTVPDMITQLEPAEKYYVS